MKPWSEGLRALVPSSNPARATIIVLMLAAALASVISGGAGALIVAALAMLIVLTVAAMVADPAHRDRVVVFATGLLLARMAITGVLHVLLQQQNEGGAMFQDDLGYVQIGAVLARMWHGEAVLASEMPQHFDPSTVHSYSRSVGGLFFIFGPNVAVAKVASTALVLLAALFLYRTTLLIAGRSAAMLALGALALWPSLALWTSLTLKEGLALFCAGGAAWAVTEMLRRPHVGWFVAVLGFTLPLQDARAYLYTILLGSWPIALAAVRLFTGRPRLAWSVAAAVAAAVMISGVRPGLAVTPAAIGHAESVRIGMAEGARSAIVEATREFRAAPGSCFLVRIDGSERAGHAQQVHLVPPNTPLVYADRTTTDIQPPQSALRVRNGDVVCVEGGADRPKVPAAALQAGVTAPPGIEVIPAEPSPASEPPVPTATPAEVAAKPPAEVFVTTTGSTRLSQNPEAEPASAETEVIRNLAYLPQGAMFVIGAPFPWDIAPYPARWPLALEMAIWYGVVALSLAGLVMIIRERRWTAVYVVLVGLAVAGVLSLVEGNLGTLVRHRGMLIPYAIVLACLVAARWQPLRRLGR